MTQYFLVLLFITMSPTLSWACASCGCTLSSDWEGVSQTGFKVDLRYDYINQNDLRSGTSTISPADASQKISNGEPQEVEKYTKNNYITASAEYSINPSWKVSLQIPYIIRHHSSDGNLNGGSYTSNTSSLGDVKLFGRFQGFTEQHNFGVLLGLKLPTGSHTLTGISTDPAEPGDAVIDRGLQPGTGTTDVILGAYYTEAMSKNWDYFGETFYQFALNEMDQFKPGDGLNVNLGFRYLGVEWIRSQIQVNARYVQHDTGIQSDTISTGGTLIYLSPGVTVPLPSGVEMYAFLQVPIYQDLLGVQLTPAYTVSLGARYYF